jgi:hypothetical protein
MKMSRRRQLDRLRRLDVGAEGTWRTPRERIPLHDRAYANEDTLTHSIPRFALVALVALACRSADDANPPADREVADKAGQASGPVRDACALITKAEADAIIGTSFSVQPRPMSNDKSACDYGPSAGPAGPTYQAFTLEVYWTGGKEAIETGRRAAGIATDAAGGSKDEVASDVMGLRRLTGVGDEAYFSGRTMSYVRKGDVTLQFQLGGLDQPTAEHLRALATAALARIPG